MKFSILHPSRARAEKSAKTILKWIQGCDWWNSSNYEFIVSLDNDDKTEYKDYNFASAYTKLIKVIRNDNRSAIDAINNAAKVATGDILIVVSDDTDCPTHWPKIISEVAEGKDDFVIKFHDGIQDDIITMPVLDKKYFMRDGHIYNPEYFHAWADKEFTEVAKSRGRLIKRTDIMFKHLHPEVTGELRDELQLRNDATHDKGRKIFQDRQRINFEL